MKKATTAATEAPAETRLWMPQKRSARGRPPGYDRAQIAEAAIKIADEEGIEALSMRRLAAALGTSAMSLYSYVASRGELCHLMRDHLAGDVQLPEPTGDWRADLQAVAAQQRISQLAHPWLATIAAGRPAMGPNTLRLMEHGMSILDGLGLDLEGMLETYSLISSWVNGFVQEELAEREAQRRAGVDEDQWRARIEPYIDQVTKSGEYPYFTAIVRAGIDRDFDTRFRHGLDRLIAGIASTLP